MNIRLMRFIDSWLGIFLCFLLSSLNFILSAVDSLRKTKGKDMPQKILFIKLSEIGAIILSYPLLKRIRLEYPSAELSFLTFEKNKDVFMLLDEVIPTEQIFTISEESFPGFILDTLKAIKRIRKENFDLVFDLEFFSRFTAILTYLNGSDKRIGFYRYSLEGLYRGNLLTHNVQYNPLLHVAKTYMSLFQVIKQKRKTTPELKEKISDSDIVLPGFISKDRAKAQILERLKESGVDEDNRLILVNPGEGILPLREWPIKNFISLCRRILEDMKNFIIIVGTKNVHKKEELLYKALNSKRCINLVGDTSLAEVLELFSISDALIANDCGLAHLASLTLIKKFIIFGPESPQIFGPLGKNNYLIYLNLPCSPCLSALNHRDSVCRDNRCLKMIESDYLYGVIKSHL